MIGAETLSRVAEPDRPHDLRALRRRRRGGRCWSPPTNRASSPRLLGLDGTHAELLTILRRRLRAAATARPSRPPDTRSTCTTARPFSSRPSSAMAEACASVLEKAGMTRRRRDHGHPAPGQRAHHRRGRQAPGDRSRATVVIDVADVGNTSAASIPIAMDRAWQAGRLHPGDLVLTTAFGAGWRGVPTSSVDGARAVRSRRMSEARRRARHGRVAGDRAGHVARARPRGPRGGGRVPLRPRRAPRRPWRRRGPRAAARWRVPLDVTRRGLRRPRPSRPIEAELGPVRVLVNNAGLHQGRPRRPIPGRGVGRDDRHEPHAARSSASGGPCRACCSAVRPDRERRLGRGVPRQPRPGRLLGVEGRAGRDDASRLPARSGAAASR